MKGAENVSTAAVLAARAGPRPVPPRRGQGARPSSGTAPRTARTGRVRRRRGRPGPGLTVRPATPWPRRDWASPGPPAETAAPGSRSRRPRAGEGPRWWPPSRGPRPAADGGCRQHFIKFRDEQNVFPREQHPRLQRGHRETPRTKARSAQANDRRFDGLDAGNFSRHLRDDAGQARSARKSPWAENDLRSACDAGPGGVVRTGDGEGDRREHIGINPRAEYRIPKQ